MPIGFGDIVAEVMTARPGMIRVLLDFRMGCVGCPSSAFHTVEDARKEHNGLPGSARSPQFSQSFISVSDKKADHGEASARA
jgi:hybrid cluster-associated redox disulfide protein